MKRRTLLFLCAGLTTLLWLAQLTPYLNVADDSGRYMVLGESLARTGDLRLLNAPHRPLDTLYPPGFPAIIAFWLLVTGRDPAGVVILVKATQLLLLLATLPLLLRLMEKAGLPTRYRYGALAAYAACPATIGYANEVMSEIPLLFLCLASIVLVERPIDTGADNAATTETPPPGRSGALTQGVAPLAALLCAAGAFLIRTSGIALLLAQVVWFWRRYGWRWGAIAGLFTLAVVGGWLGRNRHIIRTHPKLHYATYLDQFTLRDPSRLNSGRIALSPLGLLSRVKFGFPTYIGMIPRAVLYMMGPPRSLELALFYLAAIPLLGLILVGWVAAWRRGLRLSAGFAALFWLVAALWPWQSARFLVPLVPFFVLFAALATRDLVSWLSSHKAGHVAPPLLAGFAGLVLLYCANVHLRVIHQEQRPTAKGYALGRSREEGAFYAACDWLRLNGTPGALVMGKPAYLLHLYSGHPTTQIEPTTNARVQEKAYIVPQHTAYLVEDAWTFGFVTHRLLAPYFRAYGSHWTLVWQDPGGTGAKIWKRSTPPPI
jgi:hypothetical protein